MKTHNHQSEMLFNRRMSTPRTIGIPDAMQRILACFGIILLLPLFFLVAVAIMMDSKGWMWIIVVSLIILGAFVFLAQARVETEARMMAVHSEMAAQRDHSEMLRAEYQARIEAYEARIAELEARAHDR